MKETSYLFESNAEGLLEYSDAAAVEHKLQNWITTPQGSIWGSSFGHTLRQFLHDPPTDTLAGVIEAELVDTLSQDLPEVTLRWVRVQPSEEFDGYSLQLGWSTEEDFGTTTLALQKE